MQIGDVHDALPVLGHFPNLTEVIAMQLPEKPGMVKIVVKHYTGEKIVMELPAQNLATNQWFLDQLRYFDHNATLQQDY